MATIINKKNYLEQFRVTAKFHIVSDADLDEMQKHSYNGDLLDHYHYQKALRERILSRCPVVSEIQRFENQYDEITDANLSMVCELYGGVIVVRALRTFLKNMNSKSPYAWNKLFQLLTDARKAVRHANYKTIEYLKKVSEELGQDDVVEMKIQRYKYRRIGGKLKRFEMLPLPVRTEKLTDFGKAEKNLIENRLKEISGLSSDDLMQSAFCEIVALFRDGSIAKGSDLFKHYQVTLKNGKVIERRHVSKVYSSVNHEYRADAKADSNLSYDELLEVYTATGECKVMKTTSAYCQGLLNIDRQTVLSGIAKVLEENIHGTTKDKILFTFWHAFYFGESERKIAEKLNCSCVMVHKYKKAIVRIVTEFKHLFIDALGDVVNRGYQYK